MSKKGFTLIELLAVIILVSLLLILILPRITNSVNNYSSETDELMLSMIKQGAGVYVDDNSSKFLQIDGNKYCVTVNELVKKDYLKDNTEYKGEDITYIKTIEVTYNSGFEYELKDECIPTHYVIEYNGVGNNNYVELVKPGEELKVEFTDFIPPKVVVYQNGVRLNKDKYTYENNVLIIDSVEGNIEIEYKEKVYLAQLLEATYFKEDTYREKIKSVSFVDYIYEDTDNTLVTYDLSANQDESIIGWIDKDYNLYIGSDWSIYSKDLSYTFYNMTAVETIEFNNLNTSETTTMHYMFGNMSSLKSLDVSSFDTSNVTDMRRMFEGLSKVTILDLRDFNTAKVTKMQHMFEKMTSLISIDVSSFNTSQVTNMSEMFSGCSSLTTLDITNFVTANVTDMHYMFFNCNKLTTLDLSNFNTSKVTNMESMFQSTSLVSLDLSNFNTANVANMYRMFGNMEYLEYLNISSFDTSNVTTMAHMFFGCSSLTTLDLSNFNTSKVKSMRSMFYHCSLLINLDLSSFNTSNVTDMTSMFQYCKALTSIKFDWTNFNTSGVINAELMFALCSSLTELDLSGFDTTALTNAKGMFSDDTKLKSIKLHNAEFKSVTNYSIMFYGVPSDISIEINSTGANFISTNFSNLSDNITIVTLPTT